MRRGRHFLRLIAPGTPPAEDIHQICDNYAPPQAEKVKAWRAAGPCRPGCEGPHPSSLQFSDGLLNNIPFCEISGQSGGAGVSVSKGNDSIGTHQIKGACFFGGVNLMRVAFGIHNHTIRGSS